MGLIEINQNFSLTNNYLIIFIILLLIVWFTLVFYSLKKYGKIKTIRYFLPIMIISLFLESAPIAHGNFYYPGYLVYLSVLGGGVPLIILMGWSINLFLFMHLGKKVGMKIYKKVNFLQLFIISCLSGFFAVCLDLLEDPIAHHNNWWVWTKSSAIAKFYGVPFSNFIGWFVIIGGMTLVTLLIDRSGFSERRKTVLSFSSILIVFIAIVVYFYL